MAVKFLISGLPNSGKTSLTKNVEDALVISHDGKAYPFKTPHATIQDIPSGDALISFIEEKAAAYQERYKKLPKTIIIDSFSRVMESLYNSCNAKYTSFAVYSNLDKEISKIANFIENELVSNGVNVIVICHAIYDEKEDKYELVGKGSFSKIGGFLSVVDHGVYIEATKNKRTLHFRSTKYPARTLEDKLPDSLSVDEFDLTELIEIISSSVSEASEFAL